VGGEVVMQSNTTLPPAFPDQITLHVGGEMALLDRACHATAPTEILLAPVELHQRNIQRRLREARLPKEAFAFEDAASVSRTLLDQRGVSTRTIDRIDRLGLIEQLCDESAGDSPTIALPVGIQADDPQSLEQIRTEVETISNFHPQRLSAWEEVAGTLPNPIDLDTMELLETALEIEEGLRAQTDKTLSEIGLIRRATRQLTTTDGGVWTAAFDSIDRLTVVGLSSVSAPYADFIHAVAMTTSVDVHIHFRTSTGDYLTDRVPALFDVSSPGKVVFE
jgi:ATP-dependent helicase/nuclease subunit B